MQVNSNVWGEVVDYRTVTYSGHYDIPSMKIPDTSHTSYSQYYGDTGDSGDIDLSVAPWGIGGDSWVCNLFMGAHWVQAGAENPYDVPMGTTAGISYQCDINGGKPHPMILFTRENRYGNFPNFNDGNSAGMPNVNRFYPAPDASAPSWTGKRSLTTGRNSAWQRCPVVGMNYKNTILIPYVCATSKTNTVQVVCDYLDNVLADLTTWRNNYYILGIGYEFAIGNPGSRDTTDDTEYIFSIGTVHKLGNIPRLESWYNPFPPYGNSGEEAYHIVSGTVHSTVMSTMICTPNSAYTNTYQDIYGGPLQWWYESAAEYYNNDQDNRACQYYRGGADWKFGFFTDSGAIPPYSSSQNARRFMYWDITDLSDDEVTAELLKQVALLGFCFTLDHTRYNDTAGSNNTIAVPVIENGITTGEYKFGTAAQELDNLNWTDPWTEGKYDPYRDPEGDEEQDTGDFNTLLKSGTISSGAQYYALSASTVSDVITWLNTTYQPATADQLTIDFKGANPADYITTIKYFPFDIPASTPGRLINIGGISTGFTGGELQYQYGTNYTMFDLGSYKLERYYHDFRDFKTRVLVYIPYCGTADLDTKLYYGHTINLKMSIDFVTGVCTGYIFRDSMMIDSINGSIGIDVPLTALAQGTYQNAIAQQEQALRHAENQETIAGLTLFGGMVGTAVSAASGNLMGAMGGVVAMGTGAVNLINTAESIDNIEYNIEHTAPVVKSMQSASPFNAAITEQAARIWIFRPKMLSGTDTGKYADTVGYASAITDKIGNHPGFLQATNTDLSGIVASDTELAMIANALKKGVYV